MKIASYTITKNGVTEGRLVSTVKQLSRFSDHIVVCVSPDSDEETLSYCEESLFIDEVVKDPPNTSFPRDEPQIRKKGFEAASIDGVDWIAAVDDDEIIPEPQKTLDVLREAKQDGIEVLPASMFHMWEGHRYRVDGSWRPGKVLRPMFFNPIRGTSDWPDTGPHCGRFPLPEDSNIKSVFIPIIHFGWRAPREKRVQKMERKKRQDSKLGERGDFYKAIQLSHYSSVYKEPKLRELPNRWKRYV